MPHASATRRARRWPRRPGCSTSPSPGPSTPCTSRGRPSGARAPTAGARPSPLLAAVPLGADPGAPAPPPPTLLQRGRVPADRSACPRDPPGLAPVDGRWPPTCPRTRSAPTPTSPRLAAARPSTRGRAGRAARARSPPAGSPPACCRCWPDAGRAASAARRSSPRRSKTSGSTTMNSPSASAVSTPSTCRRALVWSLRPSTPSTPASNMRRPVQRRGLAVAHHQPPGHPDEARERHREPEDLVEGAGDEAAVDAARRTLEGRRRTRPRRRRVALDTEHERRGQRVGRRR